MVKKTDTSRAAVLSALVAICAPLAGARADWTPTNYEIHVRHLDLDPATEVAARRVLDRLSDAASEACGASHFSLRELQAVVRASNCWIDSMSEVVVRIDSARLTEAFRDQLRREHHAD